MTRRAAWLAAGIAVGAVAVTVMATAGAETRRRLGESAEIVRRRGGETASIVRTRVALAAGEVAERWTSTTGDLRSHFEETTDQWRDRGSEGIGRALLQAAEARDASLAPIDDDEDDEDRPPES